MNRGGVVVPAQELHLRLYRTHGRVDLNRLLKTVEILRPKLLKKGVNEWSNVAALTLQLRVDLHVAVLCDAHKGILSDHRGECLAVGYSWQPHGINRGILEDEAIRRRREDPVVNYPALVALRRRGDGRHRSQEQQRDDFSHTGWIQYEAKRTQKCYKLLKTQMI